MQTLILLVCIACLCVALVLCWMRPMGQRHEACGLDSAKDVRHPTYPPMQDEYYERKG